MPLSRRTAIKSLAAITGASALGIRAALAETTAPAPSLTGLKQSVCKWCIKSLSLEELAKQGAKVGLQSIELLDPAEWPVVQKEGLTIAIANGTNGIGKGYNRVENHAGFVSTMETRIAECANAGIEKVIIFSGNREGMSDEQGLENCVTGVKQLMAAAEKHKVTVCMELLNSKINHPDYMCDKSAWGIELVKRVGSERFKLLYDIYHMQIMEGDVIRTIKEQHKYFGHYHTAGNPGRHEFAPQDVQELNYPAIMRTIKESGYTGFIGQEFIPTREPIAALQEAMALCRV